MRRVLIIAVATSVLCTGAAIALMYTPGVYTAGEKKGPGVRIRFKPGSFAVERIAYTARCRSPQGSFRRRVAFVARRSASLTGAVDALGNFSGRYKSPADMFGQNDVFRVKGHVAG